MEDIIKRINRDGYIIIDMNNLSRENEREKICKKYVNSSLQNTTKCDIISFNYRISET